MGWTPTTSFRRSRSIIPGQTTRARSAVGTGTSAGSSSSTTAVLLRNPPLQNPTAPEPSKKVRICHRTSSQSNPYSSGNRRSPTTATSREAASTTPAPSIRRRTGRHHPAVRVRRQGRERPAVPGLQLERRRPGDLPERLRSPRSTEARADHPDPELRRADGQRVPRALRVREPERNQHRAALEREPLLAGAAESRTTDRFRGRAAPRRLPGRLEREPVDVDVD